MGSASDALVGTEVGSYVIQRTLGVGGMGAVYLGVHPLIGKRVAIKVLHAEFADKPDVVGRFFNEARAVSLLRHPNIVELIDFGKLDLPSGDPMHYCIMELLEGETLRDRIKRGPSTEEEALYIANQIADAVAAAHRQQIIHRDLKPENVFLVGPQRTTVKILDFGIAKLHDQGAASVQTQAGVLLGTPSYMSPEQCMGRAVDKRTDVYALGIILFEMCTGRVPYIGEGYADLLIKQISADLPSPRSINPALTIGIEKVIAKSLEKDPAARFASMEDFQAAMAAPSELAGPTQAMTEASPVDLDETVVSPASTTLSGSAGEVSGPNDATVVPPDQQLAMPPRRSGAGLVIGIVVGLLALGGGAAVFLLRPPSKPQPVVVPPPPPPEVKKTRLHINSDPAGTEVRNGDTKALLGKTPFDAEIPADGSLLRLEVKRDGFKEQVRAVLLTDREYALTFRLEATEPAPPKEEPKAEKAEKPKKDKDKKPSRHLPRPPKDRLGDDILAPNLGN